MAVANVTLIIYGATLTYTLNVSTVTLAVKKNTDGNYNFDWL